MIYGIYIYSCYGIGLSGCGFRRSRNEMYGAGISRRDWRMAGTGT